MVGIRGIQDSEPTLDPGHILISQRNRIPTTTRPGTASRPARTIAVTILNSARPGIFICHASGPRRNLARLIQREATSLHSFRAASRFSRPSITAEIRARPSRSWSSSTLRTAPDPPTHPTNQLLRALCVSIFRLTTLVPCPGPSLPPEACNRQRPSGANHLIRAVARTGRRPSPTQRGGRKSLELLPEICILLVTVHMYISRSMRAHNAMSRLPSTMYPLVDPALRRFTPCRAIPPQQTLRHQRYETSNSHT